MQCTNCNAELEPGAKFCDNCGAPVPAVPEDSTSQATMMAGKQDLEPAEFPTPVDEPAPVGAEPEEPLFGIASPVEDMATTAEEAVSPWVQPEGPAEVFPVQPAGVEAFDQPVPQEIPYIAPPAASLPESSYIPPAATFPESSYAPPLAADKVMGIGATTAGIIALILGIIGLLFSCVGCGGLFSLFGAIIGGMTLRTSGRVPGLIGMILSILGLVIALIMLCIFGWIIIGSSQVNYY